MAAMHAGSCAETGHCDQYDILAIAQQVVRLVGSRDSGREAVRDHREQMLRS
jgi:hypothetical protein